MIATCGHACEKADNPSGVSWWNGCRCYREGVGVKVYLIIGDGGLNGPWTIGAYREPRDTRAVYRRWFDELTERREMHPYENGFVQYEINLDTLEVSEVDRS